MKNNDFCECPSLPAMDGKGVVSKARSQKDVSKWTYHGPTPFHIFGRGDFLMQDHLNPFGASLV